MEVESSCFLNLLHLRLLLCPVHYLDRLRNYALQPLFNDVWQIYGTNCRPPGMENGRRYGYDYLSLGHTVDLDVCIRMRWYVPTIQMP